MNINVKNISQSEALIEIEGVIGVPEKSQYADSAGDERVATYEKFRRLMETITAGGVQKLRVNICSTGGSVEDALLIHAALCALQGVEIETRCYGFVASAATIIAQAASRGRRYVASTAMYLVHNSSTVVEGNAAEASAAAAMLAKTDRRIAHIYAARADRDVEYFAELMSRDEGRGEWLSAHEVVEHGLADKVEQVSPIRNFMGRVRNFLRSVLDVPFDQDQALAQPDDQSAMLESAVQHEAVSNILEGEPTEMTELGEDGVEVPEPVDCVGNQCDHGQCVDVDESHEHQAAGNVAPKVDGACARQTIQDSPTQQVSQTLHAEQYVPLEAAPTVTMPKDDPVIESSAVNLRGNRKSYTEDAELFR